MKARSSYVCQQCAYETPQWYGKCPNCGAWNSLVETVKEAPAAAVSGVRRGIASPGGARAQKLSEVRHIEKNRLKSGFAEYDRVMGGGIVPGSVTLLAGDPGIGKSTLLLHVLSHIGGLYVSGEESAEQIKLRAKRLGIAGENIRVLSENDLESIMGVLAEEKTLGLIDSIQTLGSSELSGMAGTVGQIRYCAEQLIGIAKRTGLSLIIIGHVTKEGEIAGPKVLEHMVDTVLYLEGERSGSARVLRTLKNRFGAVEEVGIFEMNEQGLVEVTNPSEIFLKDRVKNVPGSVITVILEGTRPLLVEIQALVVPSQLAIPRRVGNGVDYNRLQLLVAILQKRLNIPLGTFDIFVNVSGGLRITETAADAAIVLAILSSFKNTPVDSAVTAFGEVGLLGEIRSVGSDERRAKEAQRVGFATVLSPKSCRSLQQLQRIFS